MKAYRQIREWGASRNNHWPCSHTQIMEELLVFCLFCLSCMYLLKINIKKKNQHWRKYVLIEHESRESSQLSRGLKVCQNNQIMSKGPKLTDFSHQLHNLQAITTESNSEGVTPTWGWNSSDSLLLILILSGWITIVLLVVVLYWQVHTIQANPLGQYNPGTVGTSELKQRMCTPLPQFPPITTHNID